MRLGALGGCELVPFDPRWVLALPAAGIAAVAKRNGGGPLAVRRVRPRLLVPGAGLAIGGDGPTAASAGAADGEIGCKSGQDGLLSAMVLLFGDLVEVA